MVIILLRTAEIKVDWKGGIKGHVRRKGPNTSKHGFAFTFDLGYMEITCRSIRSISDVFSLLSAKLDGEIFMVDTICIRHEDPMTKPLCFLDKATGFSILVDFGLKKNVRMNLDYFLFHSPNNSFSVFT